VITTHDLPRRNVTQDKLVLVPTNALVAGVAAGGFPGLAVCSFH
jgi:hypothetical protein